LFQLSQSTEIQKKIIKYGSVAAALTAIITLGVQVFPHAEPYLPATHKHVDERMEPFMRRVDVLTVNTSIQKIYEFWRSKCRGVASATVDSDMDTYYDDFLRVKGREHNWRDNNGGNEEEVFVIIRSKGDC